jgi:hypothetical protein
MKQTIMAARRQNAHNRLVLECQRLAAVLGLPDPLGLETQERQPAVRQLRRDEFLGEFLTNVRVKVLDGPTAVTQLEQAEGYLSQAEILAIPGLTATSKKAIEAYFASLENDARTD